MLNTNYNLNQDLACGDHGRCNQNAALGLGSGVSATCSAWSVRSAARIVQIHVCTCTCRKQTFRQTALQVASMLRSEAGVWCRPIEDANGVVDGQRRCV